MRPAEREFESLATRIDGSDWPDVKITVLSLLFGDLPYADLSIANNRRYCQAHGYNFVLAKPDAPPVPDRNPIWYKVLRSAEYLLEADYLLFLDADAYIFNRMIKVETLAEMLADGAMILSIDPPWSDTSANTGGFLVRRCGLAFDILRDWWSVPLSYPHHGHIWPIEQAAFNEVIRAFDQYNAGIRVIDERWLNGKGSPDDFIRHPCGQSIEEKIARIKNDCL